MGIEQVPFVIWNVIILETAWLNGIHQLISPRDLQTWDKPIGSIEVATETGSRGNGSHQDRWASSELDTFDSLIVLFSCAKGRWQDKQLPALAATHNPDDLGWTLYYAIFCFAVGAWQEVALFVVLENKDLLFPLFYVPIEEGLFKKADISATSSKLAEMNNGYAICCFMHVGTYIVYSCLHNRDVVSNIPTDKLWQAVSESSSEIYHMTDNSECHKCKVIKFSPVKCFFWML